MPALETRRSNHGIASQRFGDPEQSASATTQLASAEAIGG